MIVYKVVASVIEYGWLYWLIYVLFYNIISNHLPVLC